MPVHFERGIEGHHPVGLQSDVSQTSQEWQISFLKCDVSVPFRKVNKKHDFLAHSFSDLIIAGPITVGPVIAT